MGESFRRWRSDLNKKYIQKGLTLFHEFGNITPSQWKELVAQKTTPEALALSARNTELANRNQHHHRLGLDGYYGKDEKFRKMEEEVAASRKLNLKGLKLRSRNWILGSSTDASSTFLKFDNPATEEAVSKILKYAKDKEKGSFKPSRERDELSLALENSEHIGHTRLLRKRTTWKHGFKEDQLM
jgi:hypothetical protein